MNGGTRIAAVSRDAQRSVWKFRTLKSPDNRQSRARGKLGNRQVADHRRLSRD